MQSTLQRKGRSFQEIYEIYLPMVYRIAYTYMKNPYDSEDAAHETFLRLLRQTKPFQSQEHCKRWLIVTVTNVCRDLLRKKSWTELDLEEYRDLAAPEAKRDELLEEILRLPDKYKTAVYLHYYEGYPVKDMARILDQSHETVKTWLRRAREQLKKRLGESFDD